MTELLAIATTASDAGFAAWAELWTAIGSTLYELDVLPFAFTVAWAAAIVYLVAGNPFGPIPRPYHWSRDESSPRYQRERALDRLAPFDPDDPADLEAVLQHSDIYGEHSIDPRACASCRQVVALDPVYALDGSDH